MSQTIVFIPNEDVAPTHANTDGVALEIKDLGPMTIEGVDGKMWGLNTPEKLGMVERILHTIGIDQRGE